MDQIKQAIIYFLNNYEKMKGNSCQHKLVVYFPEKIDELIMKIKSYQKGGN